MEYRIAVASTDGKVVNQHFGRAEQFHILSADGETMCCRYEESRRTSPLCGGGDHDPGELKKAAELLADCDYLLVSRIGPGARQDLMERGIEVFELPGLIEDSLRRLLSYLEVQKLLDGGTGPFGE